MNELERRLFCREDPPEESALHESTVNELALNEHRTDTSSRLLTRDGISITPRDRDLPLSFSEETVWYASRVVRDQSSLIIERAMRLSGDLNIRALHRSVDTIAQRHEILRTSFNLKGGTLIRVVSPSVPGNLDFLDLRRTPKPSTTEEFARLVDENI